MLNAVWNIVRETESEGRVTYFINPRTNQVIASNFLLSAELCHRRRHPLFDDRCGNIKSAKIWLIPILI